MAYIIVQNFDGNLMALGPYLEEVPEDDFIMKHGVQIELQPYSKCDAVVNINSLRRLIEAAIELNGLVSEDESRRDMWIDEAIELGESIDLVRKWTMPYFQQNFAED